MPITLRNADTWKHNKLFLFLHDSSNDRGRGSKTQKPSTALGRWKHLAPQKRKHESNSLAAAAAIPQDFHIPSTMKTCTEGLQNWKAEQAHQASGTHHRTELWLMQFLHYQSMCVSICPWLSREALDRAQQKPPRSCPSSVKDQFHGTAQTCPTIWRETSDSRFFPCSVLVEVQWPGVFNWIVTNSSRQNQSLFQALRGYTWEWSKIKVIYHRKKPLNLL